MSNLGDVFGTPAAVEVQQPNPLAGKLGPRPQPAATAANVVQLAPAQSELEPEHEPPAAVAPEPATTRPEQVPTFDPQADDDAAEDALTSQIPVYVLPAVVTAVRRRRRGRTNAQIAYEAINAKRGELRELVAAHRRTFTASVPPGGLFAPQPSDSRARGAHRRVLWTFKATGPNQVTLDRLVAETGAQSRSELVAAALEAHLLRRTSR